MRDFVEQEGGITVTLATDKHTYQQDEPIAVLFELVNLSPAPLRLNFANAQHFELVMKDEADNEVWCWSRRRKFAPDEGQETLRLGYPGLSYDVEIVAGLPPGRYRIEATLMDSGRSAAATTVITVVMVE